MSIRLPKGLVTISQAKKLKKLGYSKETVYYLLKEIKVKGFLGDHNHRICFTGTELKKTLPFISIPTLDEVIDWYISNEAKRGKRLFCRLSVYCGNNYILEYYNDVSPYFYVAENSLIKCKRKFVNRIIADITKDKNNLRRSR